MQPLFAIPCAIVLLAGVAFAEEAPAKPASPAAVAADKEYQRAIDAAEQACRSAKLAANKRLVEKLTIAMKVATKAGDLDEANRISAQIKTAKEQIALLSDPNGGGGAADLAAVKYTVWSATVGPHWTMWLLADGTARNDRKNNGAWKQKGDAIEVKWSWGTCLFTLSADGKTLSGKNERSEEIAARLVGSSTTGAAAPPQ